MTHRAQQQLIVLSAVDRGELLMTEAADLLGLSTRQIRRLRGAVRRHGPKALVHGNRGRPSPRRVADAIRARIVRLAKTTYARINHTHLSELLAERDSIVLSQPTIHRILRAAGVPSPRVRRPPQHRSRRDRMPQAGMLIQCDGSHHPWLEDRGPQLVLHAAVDDATGQVLAGYFDEAETARGYMQLFRQVALGPGLPLAVYSDRHGIFKRDGSARWTLEEQFQGRRAPTQIGRLLHELGITWVPASSPQAKGRIERLFGALHDRLVTELRLADIRSRDAANRFLPRFLAQYNARFARRPAQPSTAYRPWPRGLNPDSVFCFKYHRTVANDNTITLDAQLLQILPDAYRSSYAKTRVEVHEHLDGRLSVIYQHRPLATRAVNAAVLRRTVRARKNGRLSLHPSPVKSRRRSTIARSRNVRLQSGDPWRRFIPTEKLQALKAGTGGTFSLNR